jgi:hypothetical protein
MHVRSAAFEITARAAPRLRRSPTRGIRGSNSDQPGTPVSVAAGLNLRDERVQGLGRVATLVEPSTVHRLDLPLPHPHRVRAIANRSAEVVVPVDQMRPVHAGGNHNHDGPFPHGSQGMDGHAEHGRRDRGDRGAAQGPLVDLVARTHIDAARRRLP